MGVSRSQRAYAGRTPGAVFSARARLYRGGQVVESELLAYMGDDRSQFSGSILGSSHSHSAVYLISIGIIRPLFYEFTRVPSATRS